MNSCPKSSAGTYEGRETGKGVFTIFNGLRVDLEIFKRIKKDRFLLKFFEMDHF
jgi:hypothetical protein